MIIEFKDCNDSIGGIVICVVCNVFVGFGEFVFDKFEVMFVYVMFSIFVIKSFEIGFGFIVCIILGFIYNDFFVFIKGREVLLLVVKSGVYFKGFICFKFIIKINFFGGI